MSFPARVAHTRLPNGLRVVAVETPHLHGAAAGLYVATGSRHETRRDNGLSHFVEHMLFRGSAGFPNSFALNHAIEERCGMLNGETGRDYSLYQVQFHPRTLAPVLAILGDLFQAPLFSDIDLERADRARGDPRRLRRARPAHQSRRRGPRPRLARATPSVFPSPDQNATSVASRVRRRSATSADSTARAIWCWPWPGRYPAEQVLAVSRRAFAALPPGQRRRPRPAPASLAGPRLHCVRTDSAQVEVQMLFHGLPDRHRRYPALVALLRLLDDGMATPLHYRVCDRKGLAYHVSAGLEPLGDTSLVEISAACAADKLPALLAEIFAILRELRDRRADARELEKAKPTVRARSRGRVRRRGGAVRVVRR